MSNLHGWEIRVSHEGLHTYRVVRGATKEEAELRARLQIEAWNARWARFVAAEAARQQRINKRNWNEHQSDIDKRAKDEALKLTIEAEAELANSRNLLSSALGKNHELDWKTLKVTNSFAEPEPSPPELKSLQAEPKRAEDRFYVQPAVANFGILDWIIPGLRKRKQSEADSINRSQRDEADRRFRQAHTEWEKQCGVIREVNEAALANREKAKAAWVLAKKVFHEKQNRFNLEVDEFQKQYVNHSEEALKRYCTEVLAHSEYPETFPKDCTIAFDSEGGVLVIDYELPPQHALPNVKSAKYSTTRKEFQNAFISEAESKRLYDEVLYQICLRTLYELFQADQVDMIKSIVFNGWVDAVDKATGASTHPCVMTVQVSKSEFMALNLSQVDLKACFRSLKGISGNKLIDFTPVRPVLSLNREDPRFVGSYNVAEALNDQTNLAAMDWLDFENLIRELFEKEFSKDGGEVKITQASRDGGVDAIAFDPDPIRGGKIVIQAKRYTNTVGVAAVRDLYGTVHNEGATKGILVTTSDYGPDAYEFIKGKPLTLLSGSELLYLLGKHGYRAKIDLREAKKLLGES
jgi:restriction system protein